ncbi:hypothetical protein N7522_007450 [Penicillium canescens]|nr:hypothetical protein N7522_007450 [Penicillium canescens]
MLTRTVAAVSALSLFASSAFAVDASLKNNVAVYYGQGSNQPRLRHFCDQTSNDIINLGFINEFPTAVNDWPGSNFANQCDGTVFDGTNLLSGCHQIWEDIPYCQELGKTVLLSIGGGSATDQYLKDDETAEWFADFLWHSFGPYDLANSLGYPRPFLTAGVDGFDFDIEYNGSVGWAAMINRLRSYYDQYPEQKMYISGAPQCPIPDAQLSDAIKNSVFDFIWVQFYNTAACSARNWVDGHGDFDFGQWVEVIEASANPDAKLYIGLPASSDAANEGYYLTPDEAEPLISTYMKMYPKHFGGVMLWEATAGDNNVIDGLTYTEHIKEILYSCAPPVVSSTATPTPSSTPIKSSTVPPSSSATPTSSPVASSTVSPSFASVSPSSPVGTVSPSGTPSATPSSPAGTVSPSSSVPVIPSGTPSVTPSSPAGTVSPSSSVPVIPSGTPSVTPSSPAVTPSSPAGTVSPSGTPSVSPSGSASSSATSSTDCETSETPSASTPASSPASSPVASSGHPSHTITVTAPIGTPTPSSPVGPGSQSSSSSTPLVPGHSSSVTPSGSASSATSSATGAQSTGVQPTGAQSSGAQSSGAQSSGAQSTGVQPTGAQSSGAQSSGAQSTGVQPTGAQSTGAQSSGVQPTGTGSSSDITITIPVTPTPLHTTSAETITTVIVTSYTSICPTGFTTITTTLTTYYCPGNTPATATATGSAAIGTGTVGVTAPTSGPATTSPSIPEGWTTTVTVCTSISSTPVAPVRTAKTSSTLAFRPSTVATNIPVVPTTTSNPEDVSPVYTGAASKANVTGLFGSLLAVALSMFVLL